MNRALPRRASRAFVLNSFASGAAGLALAASAVIGTAVSASASNFTPGNIVVVRVGDGAASLSPAATAVFLDEYTPGGTLVQTIALPTSISGSNFRLTNSGTATSEGFLNLSADGQYFVHGGYDAALGTASIASTTSAANARVVARVDLNGNIDTSTALGDAYSAGNIRSATSDDGTQFWTGGTASSTGGVRYASLGATTTTQLSTTITNTRVIGIYAGQLYVSSSTGTFLGVSSVGTGLPTTSGETITLLPGFPTTAGPSTYDYFFADPNTLYVADDRAGVAGGVQKWTLSAGTWTLQYTLNPSTGGCRGLTGYVSSGVATLFATTTQSNANDIVSVTDTGPSSLFSTVASAAGNTAFRGLRYLEITNAPVNYCTAGTTTNSCTATMSATGSPSVSQTSGLMVSCNNVEGVKQGIIFYGNIGPVASPWGIGGSSFLCVKSPTQRTGTQNTGGTANQCDGTMSLDLLAYLAANPTAVGNPFSAGQKCWIQGWFRDPPAVKTTSLSDGLEITFVP